MIVELLRLVIVLSGAAILGLAGCIDPQSGAPRTPAGLAVVAGEQSATLDWDPNPECDLERYTIYRGTISGELQSVANVPAGVERHTETGLANGVEYFYAIDAVNTAGQRSPRTAPVSVMPQASDGDGPRITMPHPRDGSLDNALNDYIRITFSTTMDPSSTEAAFSIAPAVDCDFGWNARSTAMTCVLHSPLTPDTRYAVSIAGSARDADGNTLDPGASFGFTTGSELGTIVVRSEGGRATLSVPANALPLTTLLHVERVEAFEGALAGVYQVAIEPDTRLVTPATLTIHFAADEAHPAEARDLVVGRIVDARWLPLRSELDGEGSALAVPLARSGHFSVVRLESTVGVEAIQNVAHEVYANIDQLSDLDPIIEAIVSALGPVLEADSEIEAFEGIIEQGEPAFLDMQVAALAKGLSDGVMVTVESFLEMLRLEGVEAVDPVQALTSDYLGQRLQRISTFDSYFPSEIIPALIYELGQARASGGAEAMDPQCGDDALDQLQLLLLSYSLALSTAEFGETTVRAHGGFHDMARKWRRALFTGFIGEHLGIPLGSVFPLRSVVCASVNLNSYELSKTIDTEWLGRRLPEAPESFPYEAHMSVTLTSNPGLPAPWSGRLSGVLVVFASESVLLWWGGGCVPAAYRL
jgi:hypothetical protein